MANAGGAWDNAKKAIEQDHIPEPKKEMMLMMAVIGDTIGDPFKIHQDLHLTFSSN